MKLKQLPIVILLSMTLSGCTNTTFNKSMDAAENALANKEFEKASGLLELALEEKENDEDAKLLKNQIDELINIKELSLDEKFDEVIELCNELKSRSNINDIILNEINIMLEDLRSKLSEIESENFRKEIEGAEALVNSKQYEDAKELLEELKLDIRDTTKYMESFNKINLLLEKCEKAIKEKESNNKVTSNKVTNNNNTETRQAMHIREALEILDEKIGHILEYSFLDGSDGGFVNFYLDEAPSDFYGYIPREGEGIYYVNKYTGEVYEQGSDGYIKKL